MSEAAEIDRPAVAVIEPGALELIERAQFDVAISTAKRYPRSLQAFRNEAFQLATLNQSVARECVYALPREGKMIEGPSVRFAEILTYAWGNCRVAARVVEIGDKFVTAQGLFFDVQVNQSATTEVRRRITKSQGARYSDDMIGVVANAACSIARRNAVFAGIPKAHWADVFARVRGTIAGDISTLESRRNNAFEEFEKFKLTRAQVCQIIGLSGPADIGIEQLVTLAGILTSLREGETTVDQLLAEVAGRDRREEHESKSQLLRKALQRGAAATKERESPSAAAGGNPPHGEHDGKDARA